MPYSQDIIKLHLAGFLTDILNIFTIQIKRKFVGQGTDYNTITSTIRSKVFFVDTPTIIIRADFRHVSKYNKTIQTEST